MARNNSKAIDNLEKIEKENDVIENEETVEKYGIPLTALKSIEF